MLGTAGGPPTGATTVSDCRMEYSQLSQDIPKPAHIGRTYLQLLQHRMLVHLNEGRLESFVVAAFNDWLRRHQPRPAAAAGAKKSSRHPPTTSN